MRPKVIVLIGRRWFDKRAGNTYHDTEIIVAHHYPTVRHEKMPSEKEVLQHRTNMDYGYGDTYIQSGAAWLESQGVVKLERYSNGAVQPLWQYCQDHGIKLITSVIDVGSRKQLKED